MDNDHDFTVPVLGTAKIQSPIKMSNIMGDSLANYVRDDEAFLYDIEAKAEDGEKKYCKQHLLQKAGPREKIYFSPGHVHAAIVTCGGLCPGLNDVIRSIVRVLWYRYGVRRISGIRNGYRGLLPEYNLMPVDLDPTVVDDIHKMGGTILGTSRGGGDRVSDLVDSLERMNINILFTIGGDGTQRGSLDIGNEIEKRGLKIAVVGIPKTIDNDISFLQKSFGFETAVARASEAVAAAHTEAHSVVNGVGLVKVMGRESGFIASHTTLAVHEANFTLIPEVPFDLKGPNGFLIHLEKRLEDRGHAVIVVAEGAGQDLMKTEEGTDASGNKRLGDIGYFLKEEISDYFRKRKTEVNLKYIDPSYIIRSSAADPNDAFYCTRLGSHAAHAAMAGKTKLLISLLHDHYVHLPIKMAVSRRHLVDPESSLWRDVLGATRQPVQMINR
ncbi:MAG: ATP-dependent 6-phosphofructokinase [Spirochaetales bacterium]|nr:ATP-dependent 6-phosphofructokinase [Spirochaetales bacterium]